MKGIRRKKQFFNMDCIGLIKYNRYILYIYLNLMRKFNKRVQEEYIDNTFTPTAHFFPDQTCEHETNISFIQPEQRVKQVHLRPNHPPTPHSTDQSYNTYSQHTHFHHQTHHTPRQYQYPRSTKQYHHLQDLQKVAELTRKSRENFKFDKPVEVQKQKIQKYSKQFLQVYAPKRENGNYHHKNYNNNRGNYRNNDQRNNDRNNQYTDGYNGSSNGYNNMGWQNENRQYQNRQQQQTQYQNRQYEHTNNGYPLSHPNQSNSKQDYYQRSRNETRSYAHQSPSDLRNRHQNNQGNYQTQHNKHNQPPTSTQSKLVFQNAVVHEDSKLNHRIKAIHLNQQGEQQECLNESEGSENNSWGHINNSNILDKINDSNCKVENQVDLSLRNIGIDLNINEKDQDDLLEISKIQKNSDDEGFNISLEQMNHRNQGKQQKHNLSNKNVQSSRSFQKEQKQLSKHEKIQLLQYQKQHTFRDIFMEIECKNIQKLTIRKVELGLIDQEIKCKDYAKGVSFDNEDDQVLRKWMREYFILKEFSQYIYASERVANPVIKLNFAQMRVNAQKFKRDMKKIHQRDEGEEEWIDKDSSFSNKLEQEKAMLQELADGKKNSELEKLMTNRSEIPLVLEITVLCMNQKCNNQKNKIIVDVDEGDARMSCRSCSDPIVCKILNIEVNDSQ